MIEEPKLKEEESKDDKDIETEDDQDNSFK
jgi:hypothetical protein